MNIPIFIFWTIVKILFLAIKSPLKINLKTIAFYFSLGFYSFAFLYISSVYIFGSISFIFRSLQLRSLFSLNEDLLVLILPIVSDLTTEFVLARLKVGIVSRTNYFAPYLNRLLTFPFIALFYELLIIFLAFLFTTTLFP